MEAHVRVQEHTILDYPDLAFVCTRQHYLPVIVAVTLSLNVIPATHNYTYFRGMDVKPRKVKYRWVLVITAYLNYTVHTGNLLG